MPEKKKRQRMPKWLWQLSPKILNFQQKRLLSFVWWCGDKGCREWNYRLMKRFRVSRATIKRWLKHLNDLHLIYINFPHTKHRTVYRRPYFSIDVWYKQQVIVKSSRRGSKVSHINNAKHSKNYKTSSYYAASKSESPVHTGDENFNISNADGLCGSKAGGIDLKQVESEAAEIKTQADKNRRRKKRERLGKKPDTL